MEYFINSLDWSCLLSPSLAIDICKAHLRTCFPFNICKHFMSKCYMMEEASAGKRMKKHKPSGAELYQWLGLLLKCLLVALVGSEQQLSLDQRVCGTGIEHLPAHRLSLGGAGTQAQLSCGHGSGYVGSECVGSVGRGVCLEGLCLMCSTNLIGTRRMVVLWFCVIHTQFHSFEVWDFGGMSCLPWTCLLTVETPSLYSQSFGFHPMCFFID